MTDRYRTGDFSAHSGVGWTRAILAKGDGLPMPKGKVKGEFADDESIYALAWGQTKEECDERCRRLVKLLNDDAALRN